MDLKKRTRAAARVDTRPAVTDSLVRSAPFDGLPILAGHGQVAADRRPMALEPAGRRKCGYLDSVHTAGETKLQLSHAKETR